MAARSEKGIDFPQTTQTKFRTRLTSPLHLDHAVLLPSPASLLDRLLPRASLLSAPARRSDDLSLLPRRVP